MKEFHCDYECKTVGESINKYNIPDDWCGKFDAYDDNYPIFCIQVAQIRKKPAMMDLQLRIISNQDDEYASYMIFPKRNTIFFKVEDMDNLSKALG